MKYVEPFKNYSSIERGKPYLSLSLVGENGFVSWNDGTLNDDRLFKAALSPELDAVLQHLWDNNQTDFSKKAEMMRGSGGYVSFFPVHLALRVHSLVLMHFEKALQLMIDCGVHPSPILWDEVCAIHDRILAVRVSA